MPTLPTTVSAAGVDWYGLISTLLGSDTSTFDATHAVTLIDEPFVPAAGMAMPHAATAAGLVPKVTAAAGLLASINPVDGSYLLRLKPPVGGWVFTTVGGSGLPITIYGWVWYWPDDGSIWKAALLDTPVDLTVSGQSIEIDDVELVIHLGSLT